MQVWIHSCWFYYDFFLSHRETGKPLHKVNVTQRAVAHSIQICGVNAFKSNWVWVYPPVPLLWLAVRAVSATGHIVLLSFPWGTAMFFWLGLRRWFWSRVSRCPGLLSWLFLLCCCPCGGTATVPQSFSSPTSGVWDPSVCTNTEVLPVYENSPRCPVVILCSGTHLPWLVPGSSS